MGTVADLITGAFRRIGIVESNALPAPEDMADGFLRFKGMLGLWRLQRLTIPFLQGASWPLVPTKGSASAPYTFGLGGDINLLRPAQPNALKWYWRDSNVSPAREYPLVPLTDDQYAALPLKQMTAVYPQQVYYSATFNNPLVGVGYGAVVLCPIATGSNLQGIVYAPSGVADPAALTTTFVCPDGYDLALMDNLARVLWPEWRENVPIDQELKANAENALAWLKTNNVRPTELAIDATWLSFSGGAAGDYDIESDT